MALLARRDEVLGKLRNTDSCMMAQEAAELFVMLLRKTTPTKPIKATNRQVKHMHFLHLSGIPAEVPAVNPLQLHEPDLDQILVFGEYL